MKKVSFSLYYSMLGPPRVLQLHYSFTLPRLAPLIKKLLILSTVLGIKASIEHREGLLRAIWSWLHGTAGLWKGQTVCWRCFSSRGSMSILGKPFSRL